MADKTIINGINVNECEYVSSILSCSCRDCMSSMCKDNPNCHFKQLARAKGEIEKWKHQAELSSDTTDRLAEQLQAKEQECEELKDKLNSNIKRMNEQNEKLHNEKKNLNHIFIKKKSKLSNNSTNTNKHMETRKVRGTITNELEKRFFDTFGIEPRYKTCILKYCPYKKEYDCENCEDRKWHYSQITNRILLELICVLNQVDLYFYGENDCFIAVNYKDLKEEVIAKCIRLADKNAFSEFNGEHIKTQVQALFEETKQ